MSPWPVLTRCTCANLASSNTLSEPRSLSPACSPTIFYANKCISKHANVKALHEILLGTNVDKRRYAHSVKCLASVCVQRVCFFWSVSLLLDAWMSCSLGQTTWLLWLYPLVFGTKLADTICYSIWPFHWWNGILSEGNVIKMNRTLKIWELFDMGQTTYEVSAFHRFLMHICMQWCIL